MGIIFLIEFSLSIIHSILNSVTNISVNLIPFFGALIPKDYEFPQIALLLFFTALIAVLGVPFITIPFRIYLTGFYGEIMENVMDGENKPLPDHNNFGYKFKLGINLFIIAFVPIILFLLMTSILWIPILLLFIKSIETDPTLLLVSVLGGILLGSIIFIGAGILAVIIIPAMTYIYFETDSITSAYKYSNIVTVIRVGWKKFFIVSIITAILSFIGTFLTFISCFMAFLIKPMVTTLTQLIYSHLMGSAFAEIDKKVHLEK